MTEEQKEKSILSEPDLSPDYLVRLVRKKTVGKRLFWRVAASFLYVAVPGIFLFFSLTKSNPVLLLVGFLLTAAEIVLFETFLRCEVEFSVEGTTLSVVHIYGKRVRREQFEEDIRHATVFFRETDGSDEAIRELLEKPDIYLCRALPTAKTKTFSALWIPSDSEQDVLFLFPADEAVTAFITKKLSPICKIK